VSIPNEDGANDGQIGTVARHLNTLERDKTMTKFSAFLKDEAGAVTVDWVVLTAAIVGLGLLIFSYVRPAVSNVAQQIGVELEDAKKCMTSNGGTC
jgi:Flp pilus assembly pilin Flp